MKKIVVIVLTFTILLTLTIGASAAPKVRVPKDAEVQFSGMRTVTVGDTLVLTAVTLKQGSSYEDFWTGATRISTVVEMGQDGKEYYVSTASVDTTTVRMFNVGYSITMAAGKSETSFTGSGHMTINVIAPGTVIVTDFEIRDYSYEVQGSSDKYHLVVKSLFVYYSNDTSGLVEFAPVDYLKTGSFDVGETNRKFDLTYGGLSKQFVMDGPTTRP